MNTPASHPLVGQQLGPYQVTGVLGKGGMGIVLRAVQPSLGREVAIKLLLHGDFASEASRTRFLNEARFVARLSHPNLQKIIDAGVHEGRPYYSMELVDGRPFDEATAGLSPPALAELLAQVADTLHYVHEEGLLHRDLKPDNIFVDGRRRPVLLDFGLAKDTHERRGQTQAGSLLGTPGYMSPEQAGGELDEIDRRADVYSLGAVLYTCLAGRPPYEGESSVNVLTKLVMGPPPPPSALEPSTPPELERICLAAMDRALETRTPDAATFAAALRAYADAGLQAPPTSARPRPWLLPALGLLALLGVGGGLWALLGTGPTPPEAASEAKQGSSPEAEVSEPASGGSAAQPLPAKPSLPKAAQDALDEARAQRGAFKVTSARASFDRAVHLAPKAPEAWAARGNFLAELKRYPEAKADLKRAAALAPADPARALRLAQIQRDSGDRASARACAERWIQARPQHPGAYRLLASLAPTPTEARALLKQAEERGCPQAELGLARGFLDFRARRFADAEAAFSSAIAAGQTRGWAWLIRGLTRLALRKHAQAQADLEEGLRRSPFDTDSWKRLGHLRAGRRDLKGAVAALERAVSVDPRRVWEWKDIALWSLRLGRHARAEAAAARAIALRSDHAELWSLRAKARWALKRRREAASDAREALRRSQKDPGPWAIVGIQAFREGRLKVARQALKRLEKLAPKHRGTRELKRLLAK